MLIFDSLSIESLSMEFSALGSERGPWQNNYSFYIQCIFPKVFLLPVIFLELLIIYISSFAFTNKPFSLNYKLN